MKTVTISLLIATSLFAGIAAGAETRSSAPPAKDTAPAAAPGNSEYCTRRDISPEDYTKNCVEQNGPPHRPVIRGERVRPKSGTGTGTR